MGLRRKHTRQPEGSRLYNKREAKNGRGGTVRKYSVEDTPEQIKITEELVWKEFPRVINLCYKQF